MLAFHAGTYRAERDGPVPEAAHWDVLMRRYGWDWWTLSEQPADVLEQLQAVISAEVAWENEKARTQVAAMNAQRAKSGQPLIALPDGSQPLPEVSSDELIEEARAQGFLVPED